MSIFSGLFGKPAYENLSPDQFKDALNSDKNAVLIDVRTKGEHQQYRIPKSKLIDISSMAFAVEIEKLDKKKTYYVYCASGARSRMACSKMKKLGFENVNNLSGGICSWTGRIEK